MRNAKIGVVDADWATVGSSNIDLVMKMSRLPRVGETVTDATFVQAFGGKGANQAVGAARAGATLGAGTTLTKDAPPDSLTVSRAKQLSIAGWQRPVKQKKQD